MAIDVDSPHSLRAVDHDIVCVIRHELLEAVANAPKMHPKDLYVEDRLEMIFRHHDWTKSFDRQQVIILDDVVTSEILVLWHKWLRKKCADIENIVLVTTHHTGIKTWWQRWCAVNQEKSFAIQELFFLSRPGSTPSLKSLYRDPDQFLHTLEFWSANKKITKLFSYWGGTYTTSEREYLLLKILALREVGEIDFMAQISNKSDVLAYAENITYFKKQQDIDEIGQTYDRLTTDKLFVSDHASHQARKNEQIDFAGLQWTVDRCCWSTVVRETINSDRYACVTEKTLRAFLHHCVVIPVGYRAVEQLEQIGFWFPKDMVDYSYQHLDCFADRVDRLIKSLRMLSQRTLHDLQTHYLDNQHRFQYNAQLVHDLAMNNKQHLEIE